MQISKLTLLLAAAELITPLLCLAQSPAIDNRAASTAARAATPVNDSVVSAQELKMSGKAEPAFRKGTDLLLRGDARGSLVQFERALDEDPSYYRAYHNLGLAQYRLGEKELAEKAFQRAIDLTNGGFAPSQFALAMILFEKRQFRQAEALIQHGLDMDPGSALGKYLLGVVQFALNLLPDAERSAHDALRRSADQAEAHILLAKIHERHGDPYAVQADVAAYLKLYPHGPLEHEANALLQRAQEEISRRADASR
jgi:tetratricopeptide (TPR) repeat protein